MKKMNKKGFTIVELVIVIAVIAILAGVLIPTFGGIVDKANESARNQVAAAAYKDAYAVALSDGEFGDASDADNHETVPGTDNGFTFVFDEDGEVVSFTVNTDGMNEKFADDACDTVTINGVEFERGNPETATPKVYPFALPTTSTTPGSGSGT